MPTTPADVAPMNGTPAAFLTDLMATLSINGAYTAVRGPDTDVTVTSNPVNATWGSGHERAEYSAALKVLDADRTVYFWELLKQRGQGLTAGTGDSGSDATTGADLAGTDREPAIGPGSPSWEWGYGTLRTVVEEIAARHGFQVRVVLSRGAVL